jgi:hypothetical protein
MNNLKENGWKEWLIEITLTSRNDMLFRIILGQTALLSNGFCINPAKVYFCMAR